MLCCGHLGVICSLFYARSKGIPHGIWYCEVDAVIAKVEGIVVVVGIPLLSFQHFVSFDEA